MRLLLLIFFLFLLLINLLFLLITLLCLFLITLFLLLTASFSLHNHSQQGLQEGLIMVHLHITHADFIQDYYSIGGMLEIAFTQKHTLTIT